MRRRVAEDPTVVTHDVGEKRDRLCVDRLDQDRERTEGRRRGGGDIGWQLREVVLTNRLRDAPALLDIARR